MYNMIYIRYRYCHDSFQVLAVTTDGIVAASLSTKKCKSVEEYVIQEIRVCILVVHNYTMHAE